MVMRNIAIHGFLIPLFAVCWTLRMNQLRSVVAVFLSCIGVFLLSHAPSIGAQNAAAASIRSYLGFVRNIYPGDEALPILRKTFAFTGYWLGPPPGEKSNSWSGKRELLRKQGFGFVVLFRGREENDLKKTYDAAAKSEIDAPETVDDATRDGFSPQTIIY